jgi:transcriptional regulator with XRE-family HTH domain
MATAPVTQRLAELLIEPRETLEVEAKSWIDIVNHGDHKALLAKAIIALANHGGGVIIIGFEKSADGLVPAQGRPANLAGYTSDTVNAVVNRYAEPTFHCDVQILTAPGSTEAFPIVVVPGGHKVPIKAKRSGPNGQIIQQHTCYIRRPGPQSEPPQTAQEWDGFFARCLSNRRDELLDTLRLLIEGGVPAAPVETDIDRVTKWFQASKARWKELAESLPDGHPARLEHGYYAVGFEAAGDFEPRSGGRLLEALRAGVVRHSGWPPFWVPTRKEIEPHIYEDNVECWLGPDSKFQEPAHSDFWRVSPRGQFFLIRGYQEDGGIKGIRPGKLFDITLPTWRLGEILLYTASIARQLGAPQAKMVLMAEWAGLNGRELTHLDGTRVLFESHLSHQDKYCSNLTAQADQIGDTLPELVHRALHPLYELFDFFQLPMTLVTEELARMRANRF